MRYAIVLLWFLAGCTTQPVATTYWTQKSGVVVVHHVVGKTDSVEKLTQKQLSDDEVKSAGLAKGKYFKVVDAQEQVTPATPAKVEPKGNTQSAASDAKIAEKIEDLRHEVQAVSAENQRLQKEINAAAAQQPVQPAQPTPTPQTAIAETPRESQ